MTCVPLIQAIINYVVIAEYKTKTIIHNGAIEIHNDALLAAPPLRPTFWHNRCNWQEFTADQSPATGQLTDSGWIITDSGWIMKWHWYNLFGPVCNGLMSYLQLTVIWQLGNCQCCRQSYFFRHFMGRLGNIRKYDVLGDVCCFIFVTKVCIGTSISVVNSIDFVELWYGWFYFNTLFGVLYKTPRYWTVSHT